MRVIVLVCAALAAAEVYAAEPDNAYRRYGDWVSGRIGGGGYLQHIVWSPADHGRLYMSTDVGGCYRSDDGGRSWAMLHGALPPAQAAYQVRGVLAHPKSRDTALFACGNGWGGHGVYRTTDGGKTFAKTLSADFDGNGDTRSAGPVIVSDPSRPTTVYVAAIGSGVHRSDDFGATWAKLGLDGVYPQDLVVDRTDARRLWVVGAKWKDGKASGLFLSEDGGRGWKMICADAPSEFVQDPKEAGRLHGLFVSAPQFRLSDDLGRTWRAYRSDVQPAARGDIRSDGTYMAIASGPDFVLAAGCGGHFYRLACGGELWTRIPRGEVHEGNWYAGLKQPVEPHFGSALGFVGIEPGRPDHWIMTDWYALYQTYDAGKNWRLSIRGVEMTVQHVVAQDPKHPKRVHAGMADIGYFRSDDGGANFPYWGRHHGISSNIKSISVCAADSDRVYATGPSTWEWMANQTFRSDDGGSSWKRPAQRGLPDLSIKGGARCNTVVAHPSRRDTAYLAVSGAVRPGGGGVYETTNGGDDWTWIGQGLPEEKLMRHDIWTTGAELAVSPDGSLVASAHDSGRAFRRAPGARSWEEVRIPGRGYCVFADVLKPGRFFMGRRESGLYRSDDGGRTWRQVSDRPAYMVTSDMARCGRVAFFSGKAAFVSFDGGGTWRETPPGLTFRDPRNSLCFAGDRLVVGTGGSGVFYLDLSRLPAR